MNSSFSQALGLQVCTTMSGLGEILSSLQIQFTEQVNTGVGIYTATRVETVLMIRCVVRPWLVRNRVGAVSSVSFTPLAGSVGALCCGETQR